MTVHGVLYQVQYDLSIISLPIIYAYCQEFQAVVYMYMKGLRDLNVSLPIRSVHVMYTLSVVVLTVNIAVLCKVSKRSFRSHLFTVIGPNCSYVLRHHRITQVRKDFLVREHAVY